MNAPFDERPELAPLGEMNERQRSFLTRALCPKG